MSWCDGPLVAFDVETTGTDPLSARIVTAAVSLVNGGVEPQNARWLLDPGVEIPEEAAAVHGVTTERARAEGMPVIEGIATIVQVLAAYAEGAPIVAFNARFDMTILDREARRNGVVPLIERVPSLCVIDPFVIDKRFDRYRRGKRRLADLCALYNVTLDDAHEAHADALAAARLAWRLGRTFGLADVELPELHDMQRGWALDQAISLQEYFDRNGKGERVEGAWPIVPFVQEACA